MVLFFRPSVRRYVRPSDCCNLRAFTNKLPLGLRSNLVAKIIVGVLKLGKFLVTLCWIIAVSWNCDLSISWFSYIFRQATWAWAQILWANSLWNFPGMFWVLTAEFPPLPGLWSVQQCSRMYRHTAYRIELKFSGWTHLVKPRDQFIFNNFPLNSNLFLESHWLSIFRAFADKPLIKNWLPD